MTRRVYIQTHLPVIRGWFHRDFYRREGWEFGFFFVPSPEQIEGELIRAFVLAEGRFMPRWPFVSLRFYCPDRLAS